MPRGIGKRRIYYMECEEQALKLFDSMVIEENLHPNSRSILIIGNGYIHAHFAPKTGGASTLDTVVAN